MIAIVVHVCHFRYEELLDVSVPRSKTLQIHTSSSYIILCSQRVRRRFISSFLRLSPVSIQTQSLALRLLLVLRKRNRKKRKRLRLASSQSWLPLLRPSIPIGWRLRLLRENTQRTQRKRLRLNGNRGFIHSISCRYCRSSHSAISALNPTPSFTLPLQKLIGFN